jgi:hypothetical protein
MDRERLEALVESHESVNVHGAGPWDGMDLVRLARTALTYLDAKEKAERQRDAERQRADALRWALEAVQHNRLCSCNGLPGGPCARCIFGYDEVDAALAALDALNRREQPEAKP